MQKELVMYTRSAGCPFVTIAVRVLKEHNITYKEIFIDEDEIARQRVLDWTGFLSVPTLIIAHEGSILPIEEPPALPPNTSPQGVDRDYMITEPRENQLLAWLQKNGFIE